MKPLKLLVLLLLSAPVFTMAQANYRDVVYLNNGIIVIGMIVEQVPNQGIKIQLIDNTVSSFAYSEIKKITKEEVIVEKEPHQKRYSGIFEVGYTKGVGDEYSELAREARSINVFSVRMVNGYQINKNMSAGVGLGIDAYELAVLMPITIDLRAYFIDAPVSPTFIFDGGYSLALNNDHGSNGLVLNPAVGVKINTSKNTSCLFSIGYKYQKQTIHYTFMPERSLSFFTITGGFSF